MVIGSGDEMHHFAQILGPLAWEVRVSDGTAALCHTSSSSFLLWSASTLEATAWPIHFILGLGGQGYGCRYRS